MFLADVKGDLSGVAAAGSLTPKLADRLKTIQATPPEWHADPAVFWDVFGHRGVPVRATMSDLGPLLLGRLLGLNPTQQGVLAIVFKIADDNGLLLLDLKDLRAMLQFVADNSRQFQTQYGNVSSASVGAIQRGLLEIEQQGGNAFFGEPMLDVDDLLQTDGKGRGMINVLSAEELIRSPKLYSTFLLWMLSELFERLPEVGDPEKPTLVFFFDEAHLHVRRRLVGARREDRAGRSPDSFQGRRRVLRDAESVGYSRHRAGAARQPHSARAARIYPSRSEGGQSGRGYPSQESRD